MANNTKEERSAIDSNISSTSRAYLKKDYET